MLLHDVDGDDVQALSDFLFSRSSFLAVLYILSLW